MVARVRRFVVTTILGTTIVTQQVVSATTVVIEQIERADSTLAEMTNTVNTINGPLSQLATVRDTDLNALASDVNTAFDHSLANMSAQLSQLSSSTRQPSREESAVARFGALAVTSIDVQRQALITAIRAAATSDPLPFHASGLRSIQLHARTVASTITEQREILIVAKARAFQQAQMMVAFSSAAALVMMMSVLRRRVLAPRDAGLNRC